MLNQLSGFRAKALIGTEFLLQEFVLLLCNLAIGTYLHIVIAILPKEVYGSLQTDIEFFCNFI